MNKHALFNTLTAGPHPSIIKLMSLCRTGAEPAAKDVYVTCCNFLY